MLILAAQLIHPTGWLQNLPHDADELLHHGVLVTIGVIVLAAVIAVAVLVLLDILFRPLILKLVTAAKGRVSRTELSVKAETLEHLRAIRASLDKLASEAHGEIAAINIAGTGEIERLLSSFHPTTTAAPTQKEPVMGTLSDLEADIEKRLDYHPNLSDATAQAHEAVRSILSQAAKDVASIALSVAPQGREISLALTKLEEADQWFHAHIARNQPATVAPAADTAAKPIDTPAPVEPAAPVEAATAEPASAPLEAVVDATPAEAPSTPVAPVADPIPAESPAPVPAAPVAAEPVEYFTFTGDASTIDAALWAKAGVITTTGLPLYTWVGTGPAPAAAAWTPYDGQTLAVAG